MDVRGRANDREKNPFDLGITVVDPKEPSLLGFVPREPLLVYERFEGRGGERRGEERRSAPWRALLFRDASDPEVPSLRTDEKVKRRTSAARGGHDAP